MFGKKETKKQTESKTTTVAVFDQVFSDEQKEAMLREQFSGQSLDFPKITMPSGGATVWDIPGKEPTRKATFAIIYQRPSKALFPRTDERDNKKIPLCVSVDGIHGIGVGENPCPSPSGLCLNCPKNKFRKYADKNGITRNGKECPDKRQLFLMLDPEDQMPYQFRIPPTGLTAIEEFNKALGQESKPYMSVWVEASFSVKTAHGQEFSVLEMKELKPLALEELHRVKALRDTFMDSMQKSKFEIEAETPPESGGVEI